MTAKRSTFRPVWSFLFLIPGGLGVVLAELAVRVPPVEMPVLALFGMAYPLASGALIIGALGALWSRRWKAGLAGALLLALSWSHATATWGSFGGPSDAEAQELISESAGLAYPIRDGIPIMLPEEARELTDAERNRRV